MKIVHFLFPFLAVITITTGCNNTNVNQAEVNNHNRIQLMSNRRDITTDKARTQPMTYQNTDRLNPGEVRSDLLSANPEKHNTGDDVNVARNAIAQTRQYTPGTVWINGDYMWVTAYKRGINTTKLKINAESQLHTLLVKTLPHYKIEVRVLEERS